MTQEELNNIKNSSFIELLSDIMGMSVDEILNIYKQEFKSNTTESDKEVDDTEPTFPLNVPELKQLVYNIQDIYRDIEKYKTVGIDLMQTELCSKVLSMIEDLLEIIFDPDIAILIMDASTDILKDPDDIVYDIIDYINTHDE
jgi:hypothetical protein